jgi:hypothetical protein
MATKPIPYQCIWCLREPSSGAKFSSESHVLPECVGNIDKQVLFPGIVCDDCNHYFGGKVERALIDDPIFATIVGFLELRDKNREFVYEPSPSGVHRNISVDANTSGNKVTVTTQYKIHGQPSKLYEDRSIPPKSKNYDKRSLALLSRAVHKIAFESLAHSLFVGIGLKIEREEFKDIDIFSPDYEAIRRWVRYGEPQDSVRPVLRLQKFDEVKTREEFFHWKGYLFYFQQWFRFELNLFSDWHIMSLTSPPDKVDDDLKGLVAQTKFNHPVWMVGDKLQRMV